MKKLSNITIAEFRAVLNSYGLKVLRTKGGHEAWAKEGMLRPIIFQTHVEPIPEFIVKNAIVGLNITRQKFLEKLENIG